MAIVTPYLSSYAGQCVCIEECENSENGICLTLDEARALYAELGRVLQAADLAELNEKYRTLCEKQDRATRGEVDSSDATGGSNSHLRGHR